MKEEFDEGFSVEELIINFNDLQQQKKLDDKAFDDEKKKFYTAMDKFFSSKKMKGKKNFQFIVGYEDSGSVRSLCGLYKVTKVVSTKIRFDANKLKKKLGKKLFKEVSSNKWNCIDIEGLAKYVKSLGGEQDVFKSFFVVEEKVDESKIENLSETGKIKREDIEGCYSIDEGKPYYKVSFKEEEKDGDEQ
jgi:hypothetical protein